MNGIRLRSYNGHNHNLLMTSVFKKTKKKVIKSVATAEILKLIRTTGQRYKYIYIFHEFTN